MPFLFKVENTIIKGKNKQRKHYSKMQFEMNNEYYFSRSIYFSIKNMQISSTSLRGNLLPFVSYIVGYSNVMQKKQLF